MYICNYMYTYVCVPTIVHDISLCVCACVCVCVMLCTFSLVPPVLPSLSCSMVLCKFSSCARSVCLGDIRSSCDNFSLRKGTVP